MKEIKINEDTRIAIGEGMKVTETDDAVLFEEKAQFEDGDFVTDGKNLMIYKSRQGNRLAVHCSFVPEYMDIAGIDASTLNLRYATESEKRELLDVMARQGLMWDAKEKKVIRCDADEEDASVRLVTLKTMRKIKRERIINYESKISQKNYWSDGRIRVLEHQLHALFQRAGGESHQKAKQYVRQSKGVIS